MRYAIGPRRELAVRTVFNILGPLTNPAGARRQVLGVFSERLVEPIAGVLSNLGAVRAMVVHSADGMDEISLCDRTFVARVEDGNVETEWIVPEDLGLERAPREKLAAASAGESAAVIRAVLDGESGAPRDMVLLNAGAAVFVGGAADSHQQGIEKAVEAIDSGRAKETLTRLAELSSAKR
jgi:anthranilate phosphoribosyltransferase